MRQEILLQSAAFIGRPLRDMEAALVQAFHEQDAGDVLIDQLTAAPSSCGGITPSAVSVPFQTTAKRFEDAGVAAFTRLYGGVCDTADSAFRCLSVVLPGVERITAVDNLKSLFKAFAGYSNAGSLPVVKNKAFFCPELKAPALLCNFVHRKAGIPQRLPEDFQVFLLSAAGGEPLPRFAAFKAGMDACAAAHGALFVPVRGQGWLRPLVQLLEHSGCGLELFLEELPGPLFDAGPETAIAMVPGKAVDAVRGLLANYGLGCHPCGRRSVHRDLRCVDANGVQAELPLEVFGIKLVLPSRPLVLPASLKKRTALKLEAVQDYNRAFLKMAASSQFGSKRWLYSQFDFFEKALTVDCNGQYGLYREAPGSPLRAVSIISVPEYSMLDPYQGACISAGSAMRRLASAGAAVEEMSVLVFTPSTSRAASYYGRLKTVAALEDYRRALGLENFSCRGIQYTNNDLSPVFAVVLLGGSLKNAAPPGKGFVNSGDVVYIIGETRAELGASWIAQEQTGKTCGLSPAADIGREIHRAGVLRELIALSLLVSCASIGKGGLLWALADCAFANEIGVDASAIDLHLDPLATLWSESQGRYLVSVSPARTAAFEAQLDAEAVPFFPIGKTGGKMFCAGSWVRMPLRAASDMYQTALWDNLRKAGLNHSGDNNGSL